MVETMRTPAYLTSYPRAVLAEYLGIKESTLASYFRKGIPPKHIAAVKAIRKRIKVATKKRRVKVLKTTPVETLLDLLDLAGTPATPKKVESWKKSGEIPLKYRVFLVDASPESPLLDEECLIGGRSVVSKFYDKWVFHEVSFAINALLTDSCIVEILRRLSQEKPDEQSKKQFRITGEAKFSFDDETLAGYATGKYIISPGFEEETRSITFYSKQYKFYPCTLRSLKKKLAIEKKKNMRLTNLTLILSRKKG